MSSLHEHDPVLERLNELREHSKAADRVYQYVESGHDTTCTPSDILHVLRLDDALAVELRDSMGRTVICALQDTTGETRYPVWEHSALAGKLDDTTRSRRTEHRRDAITHLQDRSPRLRLREDTPLAPLQGPREWTRGNPGEIYHER